MQNKILFSSNCIEVQCDRTDIDTQSKLVDIYPIHKNRINTSFKMSPHKAPEILKLLRGIDETNIAAAPTKIQEYFYKEINWRQDYADLVKNGPRHPGVISSRLTLKPHQELGREIARIQDRFAFFFDTRTGKTPLSLTIIHDDILQHPTAKWLVVCPLILIYNAWLEDAAKFYPEIPTINLHAATPAKRQLAMAKQGTIYLTNTESFISYRTYFDKMGFKGCIVDESSDLKSNKSKVSKDMIEFAQTMQRFYLLAGTPAPNGEWEYYMQMCAIDYYGWQSSYTQFKEYYFVNLSFNAQYEKLALRPDRKDELYAMIKSSALYVDKEDVLDTPGRDFEEVEYDMPKDLLEHYRLFKNELYLEVKNKSVDDLENLVRITAKNVGSKLNKLNQISSGFIMDTKAAKENKFYGTELDEWYLLDDYRFKALQDLLNRPNIIGEQVLIWANYRREFDLIKSLLGTRCQCVYGGASIDEKNAAIRNFKAGKIQYLIANPASADKGLTLTNCHISIYFSLNWSYELFKQSADRIYGDKSIQPLFCNYYIMLAKYTIDEVLYRDVLQGKKDSSYAVLNHLKSEALS